MSEQKTRSVGLVVTSDTTLADHLVHELRTLDWIAVSVDSCDVALEMLDVEAKPSGHHHQLHR